MSIGSVVRRLAGPFESRICAAYRAFFVNIPRCMTNIAPVIPVDATVIDVGGGDGEFVNELLRLRSDLTVVMIDLRESIGLQLQEAHRARVSLHPSTSLAQYHAKAHARADALLVSDVLHHVPVMERAQFLAECLDLVKPGGVLILKDMAPKGLKAKLALWADLYISGDRNVVLLTPERATEMVEAAGQLRARASLLDPADQPNYAIAFS